MKLVIYSLFIALGIPFFTFSLEPKDPIDACERFINEAEKKSCEAKVSNKNVDWYASSLCEKIHDDKLFFSCFDILAKSSFDPKAVEHCENIANEDDTSRFKCIDVVKNKTLGACGSKKDLTSFEGCINGPSSRLPASDRKFYQK